MGSCVLIPKACPKIATDTPVHPLTSEYPTLRNPLGTSFLLLFGAIRVPWEYDFPIDLLIAYRSKRNTPCPTEFPDEREVKLRHEIFRHHADSTPTAARRL